MSAKYFGCHELVHFDPPRQIGRNSNILHVINAYVLSGGYLLEYWLVYVGASLLGLS
jgi:hypothetical protein